MSGDFFGKAISLTLCQCPTGTAVIGAGTAWLWLCQSGVNMFKTNPKSLLLSRWDGDGAAPLLAMGFQSIKAIVGKLPPEEELGWLGASQVME